MDEELEAGPASRRWTFWVRLAVGAVTAVGGAAISLLIVALGHCSAFGGRCPADPEPLLQNDVFGSVAVTIAITVWVVSLCLRPSRKGAMVGMLVGVPIGALAGLAATAIASG